jgi:hypothetical protein
MSIPNSPTSIRTFPDDYPLLWFSDRDVWHLRDAYEGVQIFGGTGSGKTSGSGKAVAESFLYAGMGGLILTAKPGEPQLWQHYAKAQGRERQLVIFSPSQPWRFNFLDYEFSRPGAGAGITTNLVNLFTAVLEVSQSGQMENDGYWKRALQQLLRNAIDLQAVAQGRLSLPDIAHIVRSAPVSPEQADNPDWRASSFCAQCIQTGLTRVEYDPTLEPSRRRDFQQAAEYWLGEFPALAEKTRSIIVNMFSGIADGFLRGQLHDLFCTTTNITPDACEKGALILLDLPVKEYGDVGRFAQVLFKNIWQKAIERRDPTSSPRPVFLWADEAQNFITTYDMQFQATARSSRAATVYLTQNLPNYYASLGGGDKGKAQADALLGNLQTKIFHANGDPTTNNWASDLFAKAWQSHGGISYQTGRPPQGQQAQGPSYNTHQSFDFAVEPMRFHHLRKGGRENGYLVDGIIFQAGRQWAGNDGLNSIEVEFSQVE